MGSSVVTGPRADAAGPPSRPNVSSSAAGSMNTRCVSGPRYSATPVADGVTGQAGRGRQRDLLDRRAGALGHGIKRMQLLDFIAEEVQPVGLHGGDRIDVDDAAAHRVLAGRLAHRLGIIVEGAQLLQQLPVRLALAAGQDNLPAVHFREGGNGLEQGGRRGGNEERGPAGGSKAANRRMGRNRESTASRSLDARKASRRSRLSAMRLREDARFECRDTRRRGLEKQHVLGELLGRPAVPPRRRATPAPVAGARASPAPRPGRADRRR